MLLPKNQGAVRRVVVEECEIDEECGAVVEHEPNHVHLPDFHEPPTPRLLRLPGVRSVAKPPLLVHTARVGKETFRVREVLVLDEFFTAKGELDAETIAKKYWNPQAFPAHPGDPAYADVAKVRASLPRVVKGKWYDVCCKKQREEK